MSAAAAWALFRYQEQVLRAPMGVTIWRPRPKLVPAVIVAALIATGSTVVAAPPANALPPLPHPHPPIHSPPVRPPAVHPIPHPPEAGPALDDIPEVRPSNDPNEYEPPVMGVPPGAIPRSTPQAADDGDDWDDSTSSDASPGDVLPYANVGNSTGADTLPTGTSQDVSDGDNKDGRLDFKSIGLIGGVLVSATSLVMWLRRRT